MSTIDRRKPETLPPLEAGQRLDQGTFHERYEAMPPDTRAELIGGIVHMPSPLSPDHARFNSPIGAWLEYYAESAPGIEVLVNASTLLDKRGETQPDVLLRIVDECGGQSQDQGRYIVGGPELVVEIARSSRRIDLGPKKDDYERAGVREYIVFELDPDRIHWFIRRGGRFEPLMPGSDGVYRSEVFPGLWLDPEAIDSRNGARIRAMVDRGRATPEHAAFVDRLARPGGQA